MEGEEIDDGEGRRGVVLHAKSPVRYLVPERMTPRHHLAKKYLKSTEKSVLAAQL